MDIMQLDVFAPAASPMDSANLVGVGLLNSADVAVNVVRISAGESVSHDDLPLNRLVIVLSGCGHVSDGVQWHAFRAHQVMRWPAEESHEIHADTDLTAMLIEWAGDYANSPALASEDNEDAHAPAASSTASAYSGTDVTYYSSSDVSAAAKPQPSSSLPLQRPVLPGDNWDGVTERRKGSDRRWSLVPKATPSRPQEEPERRQQGRRSTDLPYAPAARETTVGPRSADPKDVAQWRAGYPKDYAPVTDLDGSSIFQHSYSSSTWEAENTEQTALAASHLGDSSSPDPELWSTPAGSHDTPELSSSPLDDHPQESADRWKQPAWSHESWQSTTERPRARGRRADLDKSVDALPTPKRPEDNDSPTAPVSKNVPLNGVSPSLSERAKHMETASELGRRAELRAYMKSANSSTPIYDGAAERADTDSSDVEHGDISPRPLLDGVRDHTDEHHNINDGRLDSE